MYWHGSSRREERSGFCPAFAFSPIGRTEAITKDNLFRPVPTKQQSKAELTDSTARAIIQAAADDREAKTQRLKQARLQMEARRLEPAPVKHGAAQKAKRFASRRAA